MEKILHYIWQFRLFQKDLKTTTGLAVEVLDVGIPNTDEGPDFFNAKIKIGEKIWVGNIEIHTASSEWNKHKHQQDKNYDSVILHVVEKADCEVYNQIGQGIPQCEIKCPSHIKENCDFLIHSGADIDRKSVV